MLDLMKSPANVVALRLTGTLTAEDIARIQKEFEGKMAGGARIGVVIDFTGFKDATPDAILADARWEIGQLANIGQFARIAMISVKQWIGFLASGADHFLPGIEIRIFKPGEDDAALAFASDVRARVAAREPGIHAIETDRADLFAFEIDGAITSEGMDTVTRSLAAAIAKDGKFDLLVRMTDFEGFDPAILTQRSFLSMKLGAISHVRRYAVVGATTWMEAILKTVGPMMPIEVRAFPLDAEVEARSWLDADRPNG